MQSIEERHLAERFVLAPGQEVSVLRRMHDVLASGGICSITANAEGKQVIRVPFAGRHYPLATGAPLMALSTGAVLMPVFCVRSDHSRNRFRVVIDAPIEMSHDVPRSLAARLAMMEYVERHRPFLEEYGDQWGGFRFLEAM
jgi:lauroyl/myristoyl acyltransferase